MANAVVFGDSGGRELGAGGATALLGAGCGIEGGPGSLATGSDATFAVFAFAGMSGACGVEVHPASTSDIDTKAAGIQAQTGDPRRQVE